MTSVSIDIVPMPMVKEAGQAYNCVVRTDTFPWTDTFPTVAFQAKKGGHARVMCFCQSSASQASHLQVLPCTKTHSTTMWGCRCSCMWNRKTVLRHIFAFFILCLKLLMHGRLECYVLTCTQRLNWILCFTSFVLCRVHDHIFVCVVQLPFALWHAVVVLWVQ